MMKKNEMKARRKKAMYNQELYVCELTTLGNVAFAALEQMQLAAQEEQKQQQQQQGARERGEANREGTHSSALIKRERLVSRS